LISLVYSFYLLRLLIWPNSMAINRSALLCKITSWIKKSFFCELCEGFELLSLLFLLFLSWEAFSSGGSSFTHPERLQPEGGVFISSFTLIHFMFCFFKVFLFPILVHVLFLLFCKRHGSHGFLGCTHLCSLFGNTIFISFWIGLNPTNL